MTAKFPLFLQVAWVLLALLLHLQLSGRARKRLRREAWTRSGAFARMVQAAAARRGLI